ncbi:MAG: class I SAM-dependent methyltransferase [Simkania negevensis]|nr:class I SAM-dependent methyltransferase [Simkania negevensis]
MKRKHRACYLKFFSSIYKVSIRSIVEVGVFRGKNAKVLRELFPEAHLYLIDPWKPSPSYLQEGGSISQDPQMYEEAYKEVQMLFQDDQNTTILRYTSAEAAKKLPNDLDLVFIDANHHYESVKEDIETWRVKVRPGGMLSGHNYGRNRLPGVRQAVDEIFKNKVHIGQDEVWIHIQP